MSQAEGVNLRNHDCQEDWHRADGANRVANLVQFSTLRLATITSFRPMPPTGAGSMRLQKVDVCAILLGIACVGVHGLYCGVCAGAEGVQVCPEMVHAV